MLVLLVLCLVNDSKLTIDLDAALQELGAGVLEERFRELRPYGPEKGDEAELNAWGYRLLGKGGTKQAIAVFSLVVKLFPERANPHDSLAEALLRAGQPEKAVSHYAKAFEIARDRAIWRRLGNAHEALGSPEPLLAWAARGLELFPDAESHDVHTSLLIAHDALEDPLAAFSALSERYPRNGLWRTRAALAEQNLAPPAPTSDLTWSSDVRLEAFDRFVREAREGTWERIDGVVVVRGGEIIAGAYFRGFTRWRPHDTRSVGKSVTALVVGIAVDQGLLRLDTRLTDVFPEHEPKREIRLVHLLGMSSGLDAFDDGGTSPGNEDVYQSGISDWLAHVLEDVPIVFEPGTKLVYASANYLLAGAMIDRKTDNLIDFAEKHLFAPLGITDDTWFLTPQQRAYGAGGIRLTPRDLAKLGVLVRDKGVWKGRRVISENWIETMTTPRFEGTLWGKNYGLGWYRHREVIGEETLEVISAAGNGGQRIWVVPELDAVVVVTMSEYNSRKQRKADALIVDVLLPALLE